MSNAFSPPLLQLQGQQVIYAGLAFLLRIIAQGKGDATAVIRISLVTFPFAAVLLLAPHRLLLSQGKRHSDFAPMNARSIVGTVLRNCCQPDTISHQLTHWFFFIWRWSEHHRCLKLNSSEQTCKVTLLAL